jgi:hypothetical protein
MTTTDIEVVAEADNLIARSTDCEPALASLRTRSMQRESRSRRTWAGSAELPIATALWPSHPVDASRSLHAVRRSVLPFGRRAIKQTFGARSRKGRRSWAVR